MSRALTFLEETERDAASVGLSDRADVTPYEAPRRLARPRCRVCRGVNGNHASNCPEGDD